MPFPLAAQGHGHAVGARVADREVERRGRAAGGRRQHDVAALGLAGHGQVAGDRHGVGRDGRPVGHDEGPREVGAEDPVEPDVRPAVEDAGRGDRVEPRTRRGRDGDVVGPGHHVGAGGVGRGQRHRVRARVVGVDRVLERRGVVRSGRRVAEVPGIGQRRRPGRGIRERDRERRGPRCRRAREVRVGRDRGRDHDVVVPRAYVAAVAVRDRQGHVVRPGAAVGVRGVLEGRGVARARRRIAEVPGVRQRRAPGRAIRERHEERRDPRRRAAREVGVRRIRWGRRHLVVMPVRERGVVVGEDDDPGRGVEVLLGRGRIVHVAAVVVADHDGGGVERDRGGR